MERRIQSVRLRKSVLFLFWQLRLLSNATEAPGQWLQKTNADLGEWRRDIDHTIIFEFRNTGQESRFMDNVRVACGCTSPSWEDIQVPPDSVGQITITYDAHDPGYFQKWIKVYFNGYRKAEKLWIEGYVEQQ